MFFQFDIPAEVKMVHQIAKSGVLSRPAEPIKARKPSKPAEWLVRMDDATRAVVGRFASYDEACDMIDALPGFIRNIAVVVKG